MPVFGLMEILVLFLVVVPIGRAVVRYVNARSDRLADAQAHVEPEELQLLREHVELLDDRVARLTEQQQFLTRLLESPPSRETDATSEESRR